MKYIDVPADIRALQDKIDAIYSKYDTFSSRVIDPGSMQRGHQVWIGRYTQNQFRLIEEYNLNPAEVLLALTRKRELRVLFVD